MLQHLKLPLAVLAALLFLLAGSMAGHAWLGVWRVDSAAKTYLRDMRAWTLKRQLDALPTQTPWGGAYEYRASLASQGGRPVVRLSGFPPHAPVQFTARDRARLEQLWARDPIPHARLAFHFADWPALILEQP